MSKMSELHAACEKYGIDWENMTAAEAAALAAGLWAAEEEIMCDYCGDGGGEERGPDYYVPCPMCGDGKGSQWGSGDPLYGNDGREW